MSEICTAPIYELKTLHNIFIELTAKNCNQRCKECYIKFPQNKKIKDFISMDKVKEGLNDTASEDIHCIYLTGAEPMTHPDFNSILRLCLKRCNVCICTNGSFLNEKKIRFLKKVEDEGVNQIFFKLSLAHFLELESDKIKYRGNYRQTIFALKTLSRYNFTSVLNIQNYYKIEQKELLNNFAQIFSDNDINNTEIQITTSYPNFDAENQNSSSDTDCMYGRTLSENGIYACPFLSGDYRGRVGCDFKNYSKKIFAETDYCSICSQNKNLLFAIG